MEHLILGLDIGGTRVRAGFVDAQYKLHGFEEVPSAFLRGGNAPQKLAQYITGLLERAQLRPAAVCAGFPSTLDRGRRRILSTPNIEGLNDIAMADELEALLSLPVYLERDVNLLFLYDCHAHRLQGDVLLGFYVGTGLGNVISISGRILSGAHGVAAELGHIPAHGLADPCPCGNSGCVELLASGKRLLQLRDEHFPACPPEELFPRYGGSAPLRAYVEDLSQPIATEINLLDPECAVLGGGVLHMPGFPMDALEAAIRSHVRKPYPLLGLRFAHSLPGQQNGVIGAGIHALPFQKEA